MKKTVFVTKQEIRTSYLNKRAALSREDRERFSTEIAEKLHDFLQTHPFKTFHVFLPSVRHMEINTLIIIRLLENWDGVRFVVPVSDYEKHSMKNVVYHNGDELKVDRFGIPEPVNHQEIDLKEIDAVITPLLAFDSEGHRLGYGKGFYDRFFASFEQSVVKIGISFFSALEEKLPSEENDIALDYCITPKDIYEF